MEAAFLPPRILGDSRRFLVKFSIDSLLNGRELPPQKKRVLAIGGIAFIVLLFASFLLSLSEDESTPSNDVANAVAQPELNTNLTPNMGPNNQTQVQGQGQDQTGTLQLPSSQRYDFNQGQSQQGQGLESLLDDNAPIGENNDPFANMNGSRDEVNHSVPGYGPADIPTPEDTQAQAQAQAQANNQAVPNHTLYCDSFSSSQQAESQKAVLAFQGIVAAVVQNQDGTYSLRIGPFASDDEARNTFYSLNERGVVQKCALY